MLALQHRIAGVDDEALRIDCYDHAMYLQVEPCATY